MTLADLQLRYGGASGQIQDWTTVSHDDLYSYLDENREGLQALAEKGVLKEQVWAKEVVRRCEQDLEWLAGYFTHETNPETFSVPIHENLIRRENHEPFFNFFVKKDKTKSIAEQSEFKNRLLLYPRGSMKSTIGLVDIVQWILNFPHIRILILTAADDLAISFLLEVKGHFVIKPVNPSLMNLFFPEFCHEDKDAGNQFEYISPVWAAKGVKRKEPTVMASSITSTLSGFHFEVLHSDDIVSNRNSENEEQCIKVGKNFRINKKMLRTFGYSTKIGTRYHDADIYGAEIDKNVGTLEVTSGPGWELTKNPTNKSLILVGRALTVKPEIREAMMKKGVPPVEFYQEAGEAGCIMVMPKVLTFSVLLSMYNEDRQGKWEDGSFEGQMNQNPLPEQDAVFDMPLLLRCTVTFQDAPFRGPISHTWDFAFSKQKYRDFTVGSSIIWDQLGCGYVNDLVRDRFVTPIAKAQAIVKMALKHHPYVIGIEDAGGSNQLHPTIVVEAEKTRDPHVIHVCRNIDWIKPDTQKDAKIIRMSALQPLMEYGLLKILNYIPYRQALYDEFIRCTTARQTKNDIPDCISYQPRYQPKPMQKVIEQGVPSWTGWNRAQADWNIIYMENCDPWGRVGMGGVYTQQFQENQDRRIDEDVIAYSYAGGLDPILGGGLIG